MGTDREKRSKKGSFSDKIFVVLRLAFRTIVASRHGLESGSPTIVASRRVLESGSPTIVASRHVLESGPPADRGGGMGSPDASVLESDATAVVRNDKGPHIPVIGFGST